MNDTNDKRAGGKVRCYRCHQLKKEKEFYHRADGSRVAGCKSCHRKMSAARREASIHAVPATMANVAGTPTVNGHAMGSSALVLSTAPVAAMVTYRCEGCGKKRMAEAGSVPRGWKSVRVVEGEPASLCAGCVRKVVEGVRVARAVAERRAS